MYMCRDRHIPVYIPKTLEYSEYIQCILNIGIQVYWYTSTHPPRDYYFDPKLWQCIRLGAQAKVAENGGQEM